MILSYTRLQKLQKVTPAIRKFSFVFMRLTWDWDTPARFMELEIMTEKNEEGRYFTYIASIKTSSQPQL